MIGTMRAIMPLAGVMALAIGACAVDEGTDPAPARQPLAVPPPAAGPATPADLPAAPAAPAAAAAPRPLRAIAADLSGTGEPMVVVAGWREEDATAGLPLYAQRNGGWRRVASGEWADDANAIIVAVDAADLDGDGGLEIAALGRAGEDSDRAMLAIFRLRDGDLERVAETRWTGGDDRLWLPDGNDDGRHEVVTGGRQRRAARAFSLENGALLARQPKGTGTQRARDSVEMKLPGRAPGLHVVVKAASGGPSMIGRIEEWNAELARLRPR